MNYDEYHNNEKAWRPEFADSEEPISYRDTMKKLDEYDRPNVELEKGEVVVIPADVPEGDGLPVFWKIEGNRHYSGGTDANLPDHSFVFSRDRSLRITDLNILTEQFGINNPPSRGMTPAEVAKKFNVNKYKKQLMNANDDPYQIETAEMMMENYMLKLGKLAVLQESMKGFPDSMPLISYPYLKSIGVDTNQLETKSAETQQKMQRGGPKASYAGDTHMIKGQRLPSNFYDLRGEELTKVLKRIGPEVTNIIFGMFSEPNAAREFAESAYDDEILNMYYDYAGTPTPGRVGSQDIYARDMAPITVEADKKTHFPAMYDEPVTVNPDTGQPASTSPPPPPPAQTQGSQAPAPTQTRQTPAVSQAPSGQSAARVNWNNLQRPPLADADMSTATDTHDPRITEAGNAVINGFAQILDNDEVMDELLDRYHKSIINNPELSDDEITKLLNLDKDALKQKWINYQKGNMALSEWDALNNGQLFNRALGWDSGFNNATAKQALEAVGFTGSDAITDALDVKAVQSMALTFSNMKASGYKPEIFSKVSLGSKGPGDNPSSVTDPNDPKRSISAADGLYGNDTGQFLATYDITPEATPAEAKEEEEMDPIEKKNIPDGVNNDAYAPWWLQDIIQTSGAFLDHGRVKKYLPWVAQPGFDEAEPTFYSPERALANINEQLALGVEGAATFGSPQAYNARVTQMSGEAAKNAANTISQYDNLNVSTANQFEQFNTQGRNLFEIQAADRSTAYYDGVVTANQQYDNAKNQTRQNLRDSYINAITNRAETQAMNTLFTDYKVNPQDGGTVTHFDSGRKTDPQRPSIDRLTQDQKQIMAGIPKNWPDTVQQSVFNTMWKQLYPESNQNDDSSGYQRRGYPGNVGYGGPSSYSE